jgi:hypothetical protein
MDNEKLRDSDCLGEEAAAEYVGITVAMLRAAKELKWIQPEAELIKPSKKELGLPLKDNPDNVMNYRVGDLKTLKDRLATNPEDLARLHSIVKD